MTEGAARAGRELLAEVKPEDVTAGGVGFLVIAALVVGTVFLLRSLNKQLKKVDFEEEPEDTAPPRRPGTPSVGKPDAEPDAAGDAPHAGGASDASADGSGGGSTAARTDGDEANSANGSDAGPRAPSP